MAKKKAATKRTGRAGKKSVKARGKARAPARRKRASSAARGKGAAATGGKAAAVGRAKTMHTLALKKNKNSRIGLTKSLTIVTDGSTVNTFRVYGDSIGSANPNTTTAPDHKHVKKPKTKHHTFTFVGTPGWTDIDANTIEITATAVPKTIVQSFSAGSDDLTVTIVLDETTPNPDTTECTFDDVTYV